MQKRTNKQKSYKCRIFYTPNSSISVSVVKVSVLQNIKGSRFLKNASHIFSKKETILKCPAGNQNLRHAKVTVMPGNQKSHFCHS